MVFKQKFIGILRSIGPSIVIMKDEAMDTRLQSWFRDSFEDLWQKLICVPVGIRCGTRFQWNWLDQTRLHEENCHHSFADASGSSNFRWARLVVSYPKWQNQDSSIVTMSDTRRDRPPSNLFRVQRQNSTRNHC